MKASRWISLWAVGLLLALGPVVASAQPPNTPPGVDHYLVYQVLNPPSFIAPVILSDQFVRDVTHQTFTLDYFMIPVDKNNEGIIDSVAHYTWWRINPHPFGADILVNNQFGLDQHLKVHEPRYLLNPALKNLPDSLAIPHKNHFKVYKVGGPSVDKLVSLEDQFGRLEAQVDSTEWHANPCSKYYAGANFPILDPIGHLVIYRIDPLPPVPPAPPVHVQDEFGFWTLELGLRVYLAVPSYKTGVVPVEPTTWGRIKATYQ